MEKLCINCRWVLVPRPIRDDDPGIHSKIICTHETEMGDGIPINKKLTRWMRSEQGYCGIEGVWWENK
jgi:hypothetical protein